MKPVYFKSGAEFGEWLERHGGTTRELLVEIAKNKSGKSGITYQEALDQALCFGWIDGVRRSVDPQTYSIRFAPRKKNSIWSLINIKRARQLQALGRMHATGLKAFKARSKQRSGVYSFENRPRNLSRAYLKQFKANITAWQFFKSRPSWYQRTASWWLISAKREETRRRRLATLISDSAQARLIKPLRRPYPGRKSPSAAREEA
jgi:uncharacterized protein YdeI (YjbR/CyaY-like superfamily)